MTTPPPKKKQSVPFLEGKQGHDKPEMRTLLLTLNMGQTDGRTLRGD